MKTLILATAIALTCGLMTELALAGGTPGYYGPQPVQQLPPITVHAPNPAEMFFTGIFDIVAAPIGLAINIVTSPFTVLAAAPQMPIMMAPPPVPRYENHPGWRAPEGHDWHASPGCYDDRGFFRQGNPDCRGD
jgi:hypothetical protein